MAAHEEEDQRVVLVGDVGRHASRRRAQCVERREFWRGRHLLLGWRLGDHGRFAPPPRELGAQLIGHAPHGDMNQPSARVVGHALIRPLHGRRKECFLDGIFCLRKVTKTANHGAENLRRELAQQVLPRRVQSVGVHRSAGGALITSRTSIGMFSGTPPLPGAAETRAASA